MLLGLEGETGLRKQRPLFGVDILLRLPQSGLRGIEIRIGFQRLPNQLIERPGPEQRPPVAGNVAIGQEMLRIAAAHLHRRGLRRQRLGCVTGICRRRRTFEVGTDCACTQPQQEHEFCPLHLGRLRKIA